PLLDALFDAGFKLRDLRAGGGKRRHRSRLQPDLRRNSRAWCGRVELIAQHPGGKKIGIDGQRSLYFFPCSVPVAHLEGKTGGAEMRLKGLPAGSGIHGADLCKMQAVQYVSGQTHPDLDEVLIACCTRDVY